MKPWHGVAAFLALVAIFWLYNVTIRSRVVIVNHVGGSSPAPK